MFPPTSGPGCRWLSSTSCIRAICAAIGSLDATFCAAGVSPFGRRVYAQDAPLAVAKRCGANESEAGRPTIGWCPWESPATQRVAGGGLSGRFQRFLDLRRR